MGKAVKPKETDPPEPEPTPDPEPVPRVTVDPAVLESFRSVVTDAFEHIKGKPDSPQKTAVLDRLDSLKGQVDGLETKFKEFGKLFADELTPTDREALAITTKSGAAGFFGFLDACISGDGEAIARYLTRGLSAGNSGTGGGGGKNDNPPEAGAEK